MPKDFLRPSTWLFGALSLALIAIKLLFDNYPGDFPLRDQAAAFSWPIVGGIIVLGLVGLLADRASGLPDPLADMSRERQGWLWATVTGVVYGVITVASYVLEPTKSAVSAGTGWDHVLLPWSIPFYLFGAILLEFMLRLGALCVAFWLVHVLILRGRFRLIVFWTLAAIVALYEIWPYMGEDVAAGRGLPALLALAGPLYLSNLFEGWLLYRFGWFSPIVFRLAFYLVWHILFGGLAAPR
jgi:hypothetical protein